MKRHGFTIIELLVALAIVLVFVALVFAALSAGRGRTETVPGAEVSRFVIVSEAQPIATDTTIMVLQDKESGVQYAVVRYSFRGGVTMTPLIGVNGSSSDE